MTRIGTLLLAGCLAWAVPCRADDDVARIVTVSASEPARVETAAPAATAGAIETTGPDCEASGHCDGGLFGWSGSLRPTGECARRAWDWLTYRPESCPRCCSGCGRVCAPTCVPPLYTYFLSHCQAGCCGSGCPCGSAQGAEIAPASHAETTDLMVPLPQ